MQYGAHVTDKFEFSWEHIKYHHTYGSKMYGVMFAPLNECTIPYRIINYSVLSSPNQIQCGYYFSNADNKPYLIAMVSGYYPRTDYSFHRYDIFEQEWKYIASKDTAPENMVIDNINHKVKLY